MDMKNFIPFLFLLYVGFSYNGIAQKNHKIFNIDSSVPINELKVDKSSSDDRYSEVFSCLDGDTLFLFRADYDYPKEIELFKYSVKSNTYSSCPVNIEKLLNDDGKLYNILAFAVKDSVLLISSSDGKHPIRNLNVFKRRGNTYSYDFSLPDSCDLHTAYIAFLPNGKLLGLKNYIFWKEKHTESTKLSIVNLENRNIEKTINVDFPLPLYTLIVPYTILSVNDSSIFFSQRGDYRITEYDLELNEKRTLTNESITWYRMPQSFSDSVLSSSPYPVNWCMSFNPVIDKYSCVQRIYADNDKLIVLYSKQDYSRYCYDVWRKENGEWKLKEKEIKDYSSSIRHFYKRSLFGFNDDHFYLIGDKVLRLGVRPPDLGCHIKPVYMLKLKKYLMNNTIPYCVEVLSFK